MSLSGLKKQFNKANQYLSETVGAAEPTKLDEEYNDMERKVDLTYELISALIAGTNEYLQPNPATRAKMAAMGAMSKVRGTTKAQSYPQTEGLLADTMSKYGKSLGEESDLGKALCDTSDAFRQMADIKYQLEDVVKHNFLDPITHLQANELKDVNHHRTKLKGRRLDYDCKKRKQTRDEELIQAEEKLEESKRLAEQAMFNVLSNDVEQISQLKALVEAQLDYHQQTLHVLDSLKSQLTQRIKESAERQRVDHVPKSVLTDGRSPRARSPVGSLSSSTANINFNNDSSASGSNASYAKNINGSTGSNSWATTTPNNKNNSTSPIPPTPDSTTNAQANKGGGKAQCKAMYDFEAQNPGELEFKEGQTIDLISQIDENWYEGQVNGKTGFFPISYVQVTVPLP
jgi:endophilin-A